MTCVLVFNVFPVSYRLASVYDLMCFVGLRLAVGVGPDVVGGPDTRQVMTRSSTTVTYCRYPSSCRLARWNVCSENRWLGLLLCPGLGVC